MTIDLILGTAGHIDHGKTSLIAALTGTDTDRLPEEKKRGITIELGYAHLEIEPYRFGIVDVPGHEKFVRQMLSGATGMDLVMLVIAADDSIKQQTREHFDILRLLKLPAGLIVLTKCDLVEPGWLEMVEEEVREFVQDTFLADSPIIRTSSATKMGIDELKSAIVSAAANVADNRPPLQPHTPFRMAIDRSFTVAGYGTVVTGSVNSGSASIGDPIVVEPGGTEVRIRGLQNHDSSVETISRGQRAAVNIGGIHHDDIARGQEICSPGHLEESKLLTLDLSLLPNAPRPLKDRAKIRFHIGTAELLGNIRLLDRKQLEPGENTVAQVYLSESCVCVWGQPYVIRSESPIQTVGGGPVIDPNALPLKKITPQDMEFVKQLKSDDPVQRVSASAYLASTNSWNPNDLPRSVGVDDYEPIVEKLVSENVLQRLELSHTRQLLVHQKIIESVAATIESNLAKQHDANPLLWSLPLAEFRQAFSYLPHVQIFNAAVSLLRAQKKIKLDGQSIGLEGKGPKLSKNEMNLMTKLIGTLKNEGMAPSTVKQLCATAPKHKDSVPKLLDLGCNNGQLVKISDEFYFHRETMDEIQSKLTAAVPVDGLAMSEIRQVLDTSRKYAVPICEYLDSIAFTQRKGDVRVLSRS